MITVARRIGMFRYVPNGAVLSFALYDDFSGAAPASWWTTLLGTLATSGGALRASAIASDTYNMFTGNNPEFTTDIAGWTPLAGGTLTRVDSSVDPGAPSGGADNWCAKLVTDGTNNVYIASATLTAIPGSQYYMSCRGYSPSANTYVLSAALSAVGGGLFTSWPNTLEDVWQTLSGTGVTTSVGILARAYTRGNNAGDTSYFDAFTCYQQSGLGYGNLYTPNALVTANMISPAALTTPRAILLRVTDALNFVRLLLLPNTAGVDTYLETVTAGVRATVASADVDWTPGGTDRVRVLVQGNNYTVEHMKAGASVWTNAFTTATASFNTNTLFGVQIFAANDNSFDDILIQPA